MTLGAALVVLGLVVGELYIYGSAWDNLTSPTCAKEWKRWLKGRGVRLAWYTVWASSLLDLQSALLMVGFGFGLSLMDGARRWLVTQVVERHRLRTEVLGLTIAVLAMIAFVHQRDLRLTPGAGA